MKQFIVKVKSIKHVTHDVLQIVTEKPDHFKFNPGQATEISINKENWKAKKRPFTFTCLPDSDFLEFTIKTYPSHNGVTNEMLKLKTGEELIIHNVFGAIAYKGEGVFIAGGAGVTPFISIFRYLQARNEIGNNKLIFANKRKEDIIYEKEFEKFLSKNFINILSDEKTDGYAHGQVSEDFLKTYVNDTTQHVYVCGPPPMMKAVQKQLSNLAVPKKAITVEAL